MIGIVQYPAIGSTRCRQGLGVMYPLRFYLTVPDGGSRDLGTVTEELMGLGYGVLSGP